MSADIVNLRQARKRKARLDKERSAEDNRRTFGRTKAEKLLTKARNDQAVSRLDAHRLGSDTENTADTVPVDGPVVPPSDADPDA